MWYHPELTTEHRYLRSIAVSREKVGPAVNDAFVANVFTSPNSCTLFCVRVAWGFVKYILWSSHAQESLQIKRPTDANFESWLLDLLLLVLCLLLCFLVKGLFP